MIYPRLHNYSMAMPGLKFKQKHSIHSEPVRTTPSWAPKRADLKQAEPKDKASHLQGMTSIIVGNQMLERRVSSGRQELG